MPRLQFQPAARYAFATEMPIEPGQINEGGHLDNPAEHVQRVTRLLTA